MKTKRSRTASVYVLALVMGLAPLAARAEDQAPDSWITLKSKIAVWTAIGIPGSDINVDTVRGAVTLHGTVANKEDRSRAEQAAGAIEGVKEVRNLLQVVTPGKQEQVEASDDEIKRLISKAMENDDVLKKSDIKVQSVNKGTVLLAGEAHSLSAHLHAIEVARHVRGVRSVHSEVRSDDARADQAVWRKYDALATKEAGNATEGSSVFKDMYITSATKMRLLADKKTPGFAINVDTTDGIVTLFGTVPSPEAKRVAELDAKKVTGVKQVLNRLEVRSVQ